MSIRIFGAQPFRISSFPIEIGFLTAYVLAIAVDARLKHEIAEDAV